MRNGSTFRVVKQGLGERTRGAIVQHFYRGGEVLRLSDGGKVPEEDDSRTLYFDPQSGGYIQKLPAGQIRMSEAEGQHKIETEGYAYGDLGGPESAAVAARYPDESKGAAKGAKAASDALIGPNGVRLIWPMATPEDLAEYGKHTKTGPIDDSMEALQAQSAALQGSTPVPGAAPTLMQAPGSPADARIAALHKPTVTMPPPGGPPPVPSPAQTPMPVPTAPSSAPGMPRRGGGGGSMAEMAAGEREMIGAEKERARLAMERSQEEGQRQALHQQIAEQKSAEWNQKWQANQAKADALQQDIANGKIDPQAYWKNKGLAGRVTASIALMLGGIGQAFGGGENPALKIINHNIEQDIEAQKANLGKKHSLLSSYVQQGHDIQSAMQLAKADQMDAYAGQLQQVATKYAGPEAAANAEKAIGGIKTDAAKTRQAAMQAGAKLDIERAKLEIDRTEANARMLAAGAKLGNQDPKTKHLLFEVTDRYKGLTQNLDDVERMIKKDGTFETTGPHNQILSQKLDSIAQDYAKIVDPESVNRESEIKTARGLLPQQGMLTVNDNQIEALKSFRNIVANKYQNAFETRGAQMPVPVQRADTSESKVINGKTYTKTPQGWVEQ